MSTGIGCAAHSFVRPASHLRRSAASAGKRAGRYLLERNSVRAEWLGIEALAPCTDSSTATQVMHASQCNTPIFLSSPPKKFHFRCKSQAVTMHRTLSPARMDGECARRWHRRFPNHASDG
ncbi:hypothetical protein CBM2609_B30065 [Cupriavidus taiwanensis]|nr:hypothetical protein CBM2609_B30065 [Cupriavidus taiwanensis]